MTSITGPVIPASWTTELKKMAKVIIAVGISLGGILSIIINAAPVVHIPASDVAILVGVASVVSAIVVELQDITIATVSAHREAKLQASLAKHAKQ